MDDWMNGWMDEWMVGSMEQLINSKILLAVNWEVLKT